MNQHEIYIPINAETATTVFCLRRMETIAETECQACFDAHEQLQAGYRSRIRCVELHWIGIADFLPSAPMLCPTISQPPQERHRRWT